MCMPNLQTPLENKICPKANLVFHFLPLHFSLFTKKYLPNNRVLREAERLPYEGYDKHL